MTDLIDPRLTAEAPAEFYAIATPEIDEIEEVLANAEIAEILAAEEPQSMPVENIAAAVAQANGADEALAQAAAEDDAADEAPNADETEEQRTFAELLDAVSEMDVQSMPNVLSARARCRCNPRTGQRDCELPVSISCFSCNLRVGLRSGGL